MQGGNGRGGYSNKSKDCLAEFKQSQDVKKKKRTDRFDDQLLQLLRPQDCRFRGVKGGWKEKGATDIVSSQNDAAPAQSQLKKKRKNHMGEYKRGKTRRDIDGPSSAILAKRNIRKEIPKQTLHAEEEASGT